MLLTDLQAMPCTPPAAALFQIRVLSLRPFFPILPHSRLIQHLVLMRLGSRQDEQHQQQEPGQAEREAGDRFPGKQTGAIAARARTKPQSISAGSLSTPTYSACA